MENKVNDEALNRIVELDKLNPPIVRFDDGEYRFNFADVCADLISTRKELERYQGAMGYITGLAPDVLVDVEDPFKMAVEISSYVKKELAELEKATAWIPVTERLPEEDVEVWCAYKSNVFTAYFKDGSWWVEINDEDECEINVTHWMPLPQPPEEAK